MENLGAANSRAWCNPQRRSLQIGAIVDAVISSWIVRSACGSGSWTPISGLLPASTAHTIHGNYGDAWVRDCVYSVQCVWALSLAIRRHRGAQDSRAWELEQRVIALMRGLMRAMLRQAEKVERFKHSLDPLDALHAKYDSAGHPVVADDAWGHLQLDATSLFLLQLAQLTRAAAPWSKAVMKRTSSRTWCST